MYETKGLLKICDMDTSKLLIRGRRGKSRTMSVQNQTHILHAEDG